MLNGLDGIGIYLTDPHRKILFWNQAAERITGFPAAEVVGKCCSENLLCHIDRHGKELCPTHFCPLHQSIKCGKSRTLEIFVFAKHRGGGRIPVLISVSPIRDRSGGIIGGMEVFRDGTLEFAQFQTARALQETFLPSAARIQRQWPVAFRWVPAEMIGGDLVFLEPWEKRRLLGVLIDVSGHGVSSALLTSLLWSHLRNLSPTLSTPREVLQALARCHKKTHVTSHHFSACCFLYDKTTGDLEIANAGHPHPLILRRDGEIQALDLSGDLIGLFPDPDFDETRVNLRERRLLCFSDGLFEARNGFGEVLGEERFHASIRASFQVPAQELADHLIDSTFQFTQAPEPEDDLAVIVLDGKGFRRQRSSNSKPPGD